MKNRIQDPPWGHWHELPDLTEDRPFRDTAIWLYDTNGYIEADFINNRFRVTWSMPTSMTIVYGPWAEDVFAAVAAAKEIYETIVLPNGVPEA